MNALRKLQKALYKIQMFFAPFPMVTLTKKQERIKGYMDQLERTIDVFVEKMYFIMMLFMLLDTGFTT